MNKMPRTKIFFVGLTLLLASLVPGTGWAAVFYVDVNYPNPTGFEDGSQQFPFVSIQRGINAAISGDGVIVAAGVYTETIIMKSGVSVFRSGRWSEYHRRWVYPQ